MKKIILLLSLGVLLISCSTDQSTGNCIVCDSLLVETGSFDTVTSTLEDFSDYFPGGLCEGENPFDFLGDLIPSEDSVILTKELVSVYLFMFKAECPECNCRLE